MFIVKICIVFQLIDCLPAVYAGIESMEPGQCLSRFDYDYKMMQKLMELEASVRDLKDSNEGKGKCQEGSSVAFMAHLTAAVSEPRVGTNVVFDSVMTNDGQAYNAATGVFTANVGGTYNFQLTASSETKKVAPSNLHLYLMKNSDKIGYIFLDDNTDAWLQRSVGVVVRLDHGDHVYVKIGQTRSSVMLAGCCFHTHFSGFLIHKN